MPVPTGIWTETMQPTTAESGASKTVVDAYEPLRRVLFEAMDQASCGKGRERHATPVGFGEQVTPTIIRLLDEADRGLAYPLGQAMKKIVESCRLPADAAERELLGAINYCASAVLRLRETEGEVGRE